ncbi:Cas10/Cmr2 second palm domain-containing protein [Actinokineospora sp.]|uniref:Cas10/Cmr2 second palm domain-containing protein n=1 Tax=Actinokineospora sp. TaxID=1872133 RepID=UPI004037ED0A
MHAVLLDVLGKQSYIFSTNKLREAAGASGLVAEITTEWLDATIKDLEAAEPGTTVTQVVSVSGRALHMVSAADPAKEAEACRTLVREVSTRALRPVQQVKTDVVACGVHVLGVWLELPDGRTELVPCDVRDLERLLADVRARGAQPQARLPRLPVVAACATSDLPAAGLLDDGSGDGAEPLSAASIAKRAANWRGRHQLRERLGDGGELIAAGDLESVLRGDVKWLGVVHADGNGIGDLIRGLGDGSYQDRFHEFSVALDKCTHAALVDAVKWLREVRDAADPVRAGQALPLVPLIASGDDLTALVDGDYALPFVAEYLRAFERHSAVGVLAEEAARHGGAGHLTAAAGVAVVKPHFPFSIAYRLCEQACDSAKALSRQARVSALDWQVHYDSIGRDLAEIRRSPRGLLRRPFAVLRENLPVPDAARGRDWRELERLAREVPVLAHPEPGEALPATQLYRLRAELVDNGRDAAERLFGHLLKRPELGGLLGQLGQTLFTDVPTLSGAATEPSTLLLDFLDADFIDPTRRAGGPAQGELVR